MGWSSISRHVTKQHILALCLIASIGCGGASPDTNPDTNPDTSHAIEHAERDVERSDAAPADTTSASDTSAPAFDFVGDEVAYYIDRLPDRDFTSTYGGDEHPRTWYTAAEELGRIGKPAIRPLVGRLESDDSYEVMLALYALMLASQDPEVLAETGGEYVRLGQVLTPSTNEENKQIALAWWRKHYGDDASASTMSSRTRAWTSNALSPKSTIRMWRTDERWGARSTSTRIAIRTAAFIG